MKTEYEKEYVPGEDQTNSVIIGPGKYKHQRLLVCKLQQHKRVMVTTSAAYVQCGDVELEKKIDEKIEHFISWVEKHPNKKSQICLSFYEVKNKQPYWFTNKIERLYWEQWYINLNVAQHPKAHSSKSHNSKVVVDPGEEERIARRAAVEASLREVLFQIIKFVNEKKDHVPPIPNGDGVVYFPHEITIPSSSDSAFGMDMIKRMLQTGHPTMLS
ncbi:autophagy-related protein 101-like [Quercus lobata]|uniref:autophagy-related protein 101-like n=1 Tax=Quercus lobata TaxID=97700 RepID=UPI001244C419|nr:autophagy-related protein 101-like [Quercus lobata]